MKLYNKQGQLLFDLNISKEINSGGEGTIYQSKNKDEVIKIYHQHIQSSINEVFLSELSLLNSSFIKPLDLYYTFNGKIAGFPMRYLDTNKLHLLTDLSNKSICLREGYDEKFKTKVLNKLVENVVAAHAKGVVIGDLNPYNIFFSKSGEVYFIDTDSYQTKSKKHSGTMLPDIRDWLTHEINEKTDYFSSAILCFHATTYLHPYKGIHTRLKTVEERVVKHASVLSTDKDLKLPAFYQPITSPNVLDQFNSIFQQDKRFPIDITGVNVSKINQPAVNVQITDSKLLSVKVISGDVAFFDCEAGWLIIDMKKDTIGGAIKLANMPSHGTVGALQPVSPNRNSNRSLFAFTNCVIGIQESNYTMSILSDKATPPVVNYRIDDDQYMFRSKSHLVIFDSKTDTYTVMDTNMIHDGQNGKTISSNRAPIFVPSITVKSGVAIQSVGGKKWLLMISNGQLITVRTDFDIRDAYAVEDKLCLQIKIGNSIKYHIAKLNGMKVELGAEVQGMRSFAINNGNMFIPEDGQIDVYSGLTLTKVAEIECKYVDSQSILKSSTAGILCQTDSTLYLLNKS